MWIRALALLSLAALPATALATILPPNDLDKEDCLECERVNSNGGEAEFNATIDKLQKLFAPIVAKHGAKLTIEKRFKDPTVNAFASQPSETDWRVVMFGGLFRRAEVTPDGFAMVVCHEIGHHISGHSFYGRRRVRCLRRTVGLLGDAGMRKEGFRR